MNILAVDTCTKTATAAIMTEHGIAAQIVQNNNKTHSQNIMPMIDFALKQSQISLSDIDCFAAAVGPGSFTGVRIGVATVKALAAATDKPCTSVSALHALAFNFADFDGLICPILDARREQVYNGLFDGKSMKRLTPDRALAAEDLLNELLCDEYSAYDRIIFLGDGVPVFSDLISLKLGCRAIFAKRTLRTNLAASVAEIGYENMLNGDILNYARLKPLYLRLSQAERERRERLIKEGKNA